METVFAPWRLEYVTTVDDRDRDDCVFCNAYHSGDDRKTLTLWRRERTFALLNLYPYTTGHTMISPIKHCSDLCDLDDETLAEIMIGARQTIEALKVVYRPHGFNVGFNVGEPAGAGIEEHLHLHVVARWRSDANFMTVTGDTRVIPEDLGRTFDRLRRHIDLVDGGIR